LAGAPTLILILILIVTAMVACRPADPGAPTSVRFLDHVRGSTATLTRADLATFRAEEYQAVRVTLRDETRASLFASQTPSSFAVEVPANGVLRFAIAAATLTSPKFRMPIDFTITIQTVDKREVVFRESIARANRNRWLDREVDLAAWAGAEAQITFTTDVPADEPDLFPLWANPVLASADDRGVPKLILISIDCLRADHVGTYGYSRETTPRLDRFAGDAVVFETAIATSATTLPTHTSMFTGFTPSEHGASNRNMLSRSVAYLPELLAEAGYRVDGVVSGAYLAQNFGFERGFHSYRAMTHPRAAETVDAALSVLDRARGQAHFLFLHIIDAHWPYDPPAGLEERFGPIQTDVPSMLQKVLKQIPPENPAEIQQAIDLYDAELAYADQELGRFLDELEARGLYDDAFIIVTADHGEAFYEHGNWQHGWTLYDEIVHVPLVIKWPGGAFGGRIGAQVSQTDIFATVLHAAGVSPPHNRAMDLALFSGGAEPEGSRRYAYSEFASNPAPGELPIKHVAIRSGTLKYIATFRTDDEAELSLVERLAEELYDLERDPEELHNLVDEQPSTVEGFRNGLSAYLDEARVFRDWRQGEAVIEDDAIREHLRSLGYIQ
jgi:arylsulfatase